MFASNFVRTALATLALVSLATAQIGAPAPEFVRGRWFNSPPLRIEELRGKAVLIEVFRTWSDTFTSSVTELNARADKGERDGLVVIGVTNEQPDVVTAWVRLRKPTFPIVVISGTELERSLGARGDWFPIEAIVDPRGSLTYSSGMVQGSFETPLAAALDTATKGALWPKRFDKVLGALRAQQLDKSWSELKKLASPSLADDERSAFDKFGRFLEDQAATRVEECRALAEGGRIFEAHEGAEPIANCEPAFKARQAALDLLHELEASVDFKAEMKLGPTFVAAFENELAAEYPRAVASYRELIKKNPKLKIALAARVRIEELRKQHLLVYVKDCEECKRAKQACERHTER